MTRGLKILTGALLLALTIALGMFQAQPSAQRLTAEQPTPTPALNSDPGGGIGGV